MIIDRNTILFFDSSCLIAAAGSPTGGSGFLLSLCARGVLKAAVSQYVLLEAQRNVQTKLGDEAANHFYNFISIVPFSLATLPDKNILKRLEKICNKKDVHVLAAALEIQAPFLLALDKGFISEITRQI
jgi:predicted nucleic acid-binding protein